MKQFRNAGLVACMFMGLMLTACDGSGDGGSSAPSTPPRFVKLDASGAALPDSATAWSCVRDNASKLVWEVKNMADPAHLRYYRNGYTNYDDTTQAQIWNSESPINPTQAQIDASSNSIGFKTAVNAQGLCGATDWRLPDIDELKGLLTGSSAPYINASYFPDVDLTKSCKYACYGYFWSSSPFARISGYAWFVDFSLGGVDDPGSRSYYGAVRLVRSGQ